VRAPAAAPSAGPPSAPSPAATVDKAGEARAKAEAFLASHPAEPDSTLPVWRTGEAGAPQPTVDQERQHGESLKGAEGGRRGRTEEWERQRAARAAQQGAEQAALERHAAVVRAWYQATYLPAMAGVRAVVPRFQETFNAGAPPSTMAPLCQE